MDLLISGFIFVIGACIGSFLNVCIYRIPRNLSVVRPRSMCTTCGTMIAWYDNIPILSWLLLKGKCRACGAKIPARYPIVELLVAVLFLLLWINLDFHLFMVGVIFFSIMVVATGIDLDHLMIPDRFSTGGMMLGVALSFLVPQLHGFDSAAPFIVDGVCSTIMALVGVVVGSGILLWFGVLGELFFKKEAIGFGDIKYMGLIGAICGWQGALFSIFGGATIGACLLLPYMLVGQLSGKRVSKVVPFGPWLSIGAAVYYLFLREPVDAYFELSWLVFFGRFS